MAAVIARVACVVMLWASPAFAQDGGGPPPQGGQEPAVPTEQPTYEEPIEIWTGSFGAGMAMTKGNADSATYNVSYELARDARQRLIFKSTGLLIRSEQDEAMTVDRTVADVRMDYRLTYRFTAFGRLSYLRDAAQEVDYLLAPTVGVGYALVDTETTHFSMDAALGSVFERNTPTQMRTSPAILVGQRLTQQITDNARVTQQASALWKIDDFGDGLYTLGAAISASISSRADLKAEVLDTFKTEITGPAVDNNTVSVLLSVVYKF